MSNVKLDDVFNNARQNMVDSYGEDAVRRATEYLKENGLVWWDYWDYTDYNGHLTRSDALPIFQEVDRILGREESERYLSSTKKSTFKSQSFSDMVNKQRSKNIQKTIYGEASFKSLYRGFDELGTAEQWWIITYLKDKLGMNGFEEFIDNVVAYAHDKYEGQ